MPLNSEVDSASIGQSLTCTYCHKSFPSISKLNKHLVIHGEKAYTCTVCLYKTCYKENLTKHQRIHTQKGLHRCTWPGCDKTTTDKSKNCYVSTLHEICLEQWEEN